MTAVTKPDSAGSATGSATKTKKPSVSTQNNPTSARNNAPSASPSTSTKKLPGPAASAAPVINGTNNNATNGSMARPNRRLQRITTRMSTSDNLILEKKATLPAEPFVLTERYILKKHKNKPPSLILHLYPNYFRFDQQDGSFSYQSEMRFFIEHVKKGTIPHDMLEELRVGNVRFYDGWLIMKIIDHKSIAIDQKTSGNVADDEKPYSIHNYNHFITPSPCVPYPSKEQLAHSPPVKLERNGSVGDKENVAPHPKSEHVADASKPSRAEPKVFWKALRPTQMSRQMDLTLDYTAPDPKARKPQAGARQVGQPPTPSTTVPPTPISERPPQLKKQKLKIDPKDHFEYEAKVINATAPPVYLEPALDLDDIDRIYKMLADPLCNEPPPSPKSRKRTFAELAADDAHAKAQERFMLIMDARSSGAGTAVNATGVDPQAGTGAFQARFERFNALDNIKRELEEKKKRDAEKRLQEDELRRSQQQQQQEEQQRKLAQQNAIAQKREQAMLAAKQQQAQMQQRQNQEALAQAQAQAQAQQHQQSTQAQQPLPQQTPNVQQAQRRNVGQQPNGIPPQMQNQIMAQAASPVVRQGTPLTASSPAAPNARPMVRNGSQPGGAGSPPRPASSLQHAHPNPANMIRQASGQGNQSRNGTPQIPHSTPGMNNSTPIIRQGTPGHVMTQASPMVSMAMATPQMTNTAMQGQVANGMHQGMNPQQQQLMQMQRRQQLANQQAAQQAAMQQMNGGQMPNGAQMAQMQAQHQAQQERAAAMRQQQAQAAMAGTPQAQHMSPAPGSGASQYQAQMRKQMMQQMPGGAGSPVPNQAQTQMSPQQQLQMQMQQQQMQAMQNANQQGQAGQQMGQQGPRPQNPMFQSFAAQAYKMLVARELQNPQYGNNAAMIPPNIKETLKVRAQTQAAQQLQRQRTQQMAMQNNPQLMQQQGGAMMQQNGSQQGNGMMQGQGNMMMQAGQQQGMGNMMGMQNMGMNMSQMQQQHNAQNVQARQMQQMHIQNAQQQMMQNNYMQQMMNQMPGGQGQQR